MLAAGDTPSSTSISKTSSFSPSSAAGTACTTTSYADAFLLLVELARSIDDEVVDRVLREICRSASNRACFSIIFNISLGMGTSSMRILVFGLSIGSVPSIETARRMFIVIPPDGDDEMLSADLIFGVGAIGVAGVSISSLVDGE